MPHLRRITNTVNERGHVGFASKQQVDDANQTLDTGSFAQKLAFLRATPISPPDGAVIPKYTRGYVPPKSDDAEPFQLFTKVKVDQAIDMIGFIKFKVVIRDQVGALTFDVKSARELKKTNERAGYIPIWWLPWKSKQIIKIKIPDVATTPTIAGGGGIDPVPNPGLFFTAAINGCSVFAVGSARAVSLYHAGITGELEKALGDRFATLGGTSEAVWQSLVGRTTKPGKTVGEVNRSEYVAERKPGAATERDRFKTPEGNYTTHRGSTFQDFLSGKTDLDAVSVSPWGCVFGLRSDAGDWSFTLMKNATLEYFRLTNKKRLLRSPKKVQVPEKRPAWNTVRPDGSIDDAMLNALAEPYKESKFSTCVTLGYREFFPGNNNAVYHDFSTITLV